jgi:type IV secretion system protein VirB2
MMFFSTQSLSVRPAFTAFSATPPSMGWRVIAALLAVVCLSTSSFLMTDPVIAQALAPVVRSATIIRDTVVAIALLVMTAAIGIAGFRVAFSGASFRDVSNLVVGGALAGGAAAIAAIFIA